jgi:hypothetical protein
MYSGCAEGCSGILKNEIYKPKRREGKDVKM